ncbi:MAG: 3-deoxy-manno-octulosonate cytidylyltransferase [Bdellovibrionales bacterium]|nr:3-deoxy-manno-octulosonate cytidylyltransferase [Bdellovibrionales bacterium]NQZ18516.1 3-deoxy-manno-octulosonate cytidylyltransferase [Bdellovibrionales bacterium]
MAEVLAVIPVRFGAQRFPGKPLAKILNKPMIQWVVEGVSQSQIINKIVVATDDDRIAEACSTLDVEVVMTESDLPSGSDRVFQAVKHHSADLVINVQGDEPLIQGDLLDKMASFMLENDNWEVVTFGRKMDEAALDNINTAKIVLNQDNYALYFSRLPIPYSREKAQGNWDGCLKHIGIYGYKKSFLEKFCANSATTLENREGLEQLRALYLGGRIKVIEVDYESWGVDTPEDIEVVEALLKKR